MAKRNKFFWHVPPAAWLVGGPILTTGTANILGDIVVELLSTETVQSARPDIDNFVVERIVGQYMITGDEAAAANHFLHSRVYVAEIDATTISLRNLNTADDAETSFLWHQVDPWPNAADGDIFGTWVGDHGAGQPRATPSNGRLGNVDIRVGRCLEGGEVLIWHTQIDAAPAANDTHFLKLWLRLLVREG